MPSVVAASDSLLGLERLLWETEEDWTHLLAKAFYLAETGRPEKAREELESLLQDQSYPDLSPEHLYYLGYFSLLSHDQTGLDVALYHLKKKPATEIGHPIHLLVCLHELEKQEFDAARMALHRHLTDYLHLDSARANELTLSNIPQKLSRQMRDPATARRLSFIPGLGQLYAGHPLPAISSLILIAAGGLYTGLSIQQGLYATSVLTGGVGTLLFWTGGSRNAAFLAKRHNEKVIHKAMRHILEGIPFVQNQ